jgi:glycogen debranching enzyme
MTSSSSAAPPQDNMSTVIAGYPWFADWGRDTMIALPGLLLATGRHDEALNALKRLRRRTAGAG